MFFLSCFSEAAMQKKRLGRSSNDDRSDRLRERLWVLNEEVEESARLLRKAREEVKRVSEKLAALKSRHWALLSQVEADEIMDDKM